jgi:hypothetical protein
LAQKTTKGGQRCPPFLLASVSVHDLAGPRRSVTSWQHPPIQIQTEMCHNTLNMKKRNVRTAPAHRHPRALLLVLALLCLSLQLAISPAPVGADITEPGDWGIVTVSTVSPAGDPVVADIRLLKVVNGAEELHAYSVEGFLEAQVSTGTYVAYADKNGGFLAKSAVFNVAWHEHKHVVLEVRTVDIRDFAVSPEQQDSGALSRVRVDYSVVNLESEMPNSEIRLTVTRNSEPFETVTIVTVSALTLGTVSGPFYFTPAEGWAEGEYAFSLELYVDGELYAKTDERAFSQTGGGGTESWLWIVLVILGVLAAAAISVVAFLLLKKRQRREKTVRRAQELVPERRATAPPVEPAQPLEEPIQVDEPVGTSPSSLSSVSTLKTRIAALGGDQRIAQEGDEGPDTEKESSSASTLKARMASFKRDESPAEDADERPDTDSKGPGKAGR